MSHEPASIDGRKKKRPGLEEQKRTIMDAAVELFIEQGSRAISISQICSHADVSRPTFYRCFKDKEELIFSLYEDSVNQHVEDIMLKGLAELKGMDERWIHQALDALFDAIFERSRLAELVFIESADPESPAYSIVNGAFDNITAVLEKWLIKTTGKKPSRIFLKSVMAANQWIVHDAIRKGLSTKAKKEAKQAAWELISRLLAAD